MGPVIVASARAAFGRRRLSGIALEPMLHREVKELLGPQQAGIGLAHHGALMLIEIGRDARVVELAGFADSIFEYFLELGTKR